MKKTLLILAAALTLSGSAFAQSKTEKKALESFISQNAPVLSLNGAKLDNMTGIKIENGSVTEIDLKGKKLQGTLDLSNFPNLTKVDVSDNQLTSLIVDNCPSLVEVNAGRNQLKNFSAQKCPSLQTLKLYRNRLNEVDLSGVPLLKNFNIASNFLVSLDVANSANLDISLEDGL